MKKRLLIGISILILLILIISHGDIVSFFDLDYLLIKNRIGKDCTEEMIMEVIPNRLNFECNSDMSYCSNSYEDINFKWKNKVPILSANCFPGIESNGKNPNYLYCKILELKDRNFNAGYAKERGNEYGSSVEWHASLYIPFVAIDPEDYTVDGYKIVDYSCKIVNITK